ncbi:MAG: FHA domain-containing protein [archaeon]|nr:FHA domain-containing protein [archaeon]
MKSIWRIHPATDPSQGVRFGEGSYFLGRRHGSLLALEDLSISRSHASVRVREGGLFLEDTSSFGTFIDGQRAPSRQEVEVRAGAVLLLGESSQQLVVGEQRLAVSSAGLSAEQKETLLADLARAGVPYSPRVSSAVSHLVLHEISLSHKALLALAHLAHLVSPSWPRALAALGPAPWPAAAWPSEAQHLPATALSCDRWAPEPSRRELFSRYVFYFTQQDRLDTVSQFLAPTGGRCVLVSRPHQILPEGPDGRAPLLVLPKTGPLPWRVSLVATVKESAIMKGLTFAQLRPDFWHPEMLHDEDPPLQSPRQPIPPQLRLEPHHHQFDDQSYPSVQIVQHTTYGPNSNRTTSTTMSGDEKPKTGSRSMPSVRRSSSISSQSPPVQRDGERGLTPPSAIPRPELAASSSDPGLAGSNNSPRNFKRFKRKQNIREKRLLECTPERVDLKRHKS